MEFFADFHFLRPWWLLALAPLALLLWTMRQPGMADSPWQRICDPHLLPYLLVLQDHRRRGFWWLLALGWLVAILALAGPTWVKRALPVFQSMSAQVIVLDLSRSMLSNDLKPSRSDRARFKIADLLEQTEEGQVGMVVFAGDAFVVSPLTQDTDTIAAMLPVLGPGLMPVQGSRADLGLRLAADLLQQADQDQGEILLITDDVDQRAVQVATRLKQNNFRTSVLGVGTPGGAPIPEGDDFLRNRAGQMVVPTLNTANLQELVQAGGGQLAMLSPDNRDLDMLRQELALDGQTERLDMETDSWHEEGPWLVLALLPLAALAFRRGWLLVALLWLPLPDAHAFEWADLWLRSDQQAEQLLQEGNAEQAAVKAQDPLRRGSALYKAGRFEEAALDFDQVPGAIGHYNRANALAQIGQLQDSLAAYDAALADAPDMEDAQHNRAIVEQLLEQQQNQSSGDQGESDEQQSQNQGQQQSQSSSDNMGEQQPGSDMTSQGEQPSEQEREDEQQQQSGDPSDQQQPQQPTEQLADETLSEEERQAVEQWLRRIPDDPGGLLRRKFRYLCDERDSCRDAVEGTW